MPEFIDFKALRQQGSEDNLAFIDNSLPIGEAVQEFLVSQFVLPHSELQHKLLTSYLLIPGALTTTVPLLFLEGKEGSGKTDIMTCFSGIYDSPIQSAAWTYAAIRNEIKSGRGADELISEKHFTLCLDNVNLQTLENENLYTLLLCGYSRKSSKIKIAIPGGDTLEFDTYCPKVISSVHGLLSVPKYRELKRRCLQIFTKSFDDIRTADKANEIDLEEHIAIADLNLDPLKAAYWRFWSEPSNLTEFILVRKKLSKQKTKHLSPSHRSLLLDLMACMVITELSEYESVQEEMAEIIKLCQDGATQNPLVDVVTKFLSVENEAYESIGKTISEVSPRRLKDAVHYASQEGALDCQVTPQLIATAMNSLGWKLISGKWRKL